MAHLLLSLALMPANLSVPESLISKKIVILIFLGGSLEGLNDLMHTKHLAQCVARKLLLLL